MIAGMHRTKGGGPQLGANTPGTYGPFGPYGGRDEPAATEESRPADDPGTTEPTPAGAFGENP
ncbi:hypothetical protein [Streptomyces sp. ISL-100]|uniref:hypothetical protein n=1 Tax=Streptomyces sp. ISL-100 TaxID=2819173 RepID=UPI001BE8D3A7|nr:hypothetical protein [Streptomyces sp. ISL-100]MBT2401962.1 hypothetical protein [Streptomyces sp. ISL-100]